MLFNLAMTLLMVLVLMAAVSAGCFIFEVIRIAWLYHTCKPVETECCEEIDYAKFL
jgi:hypothetical protein